MQEHIRHSHHNGLLIRKCHVCGKTMESKQELSKCGHCGKSFLPLCYFEKIHDHENEELSELYAHVEEIEPEHLIKGLFVIW